MRKQALILGLGQFGLSVARALQERKVEVMVVDRDPKLVQQAAEFVAEAVSFDAADEAALARTSPGDRDICVVAMGDESRDGSIVTTALLRQMGAPMIVARASDTIHERILRLVGAHEIVNPEREFGERLASRLAHSGVIDQVALGDDLILTELRVPAKMVGRTLEDSRLPKRFGVTVVAVRKKDDGPGRVEPPNPRVPLAENDILIVTGTNDAIATLVEKF